MVKSLASPQKESFLLVTFQYGDPSSPTFAYYTNRSEDWGGLYVSTPAMSVELPKNCGTFSDDTCTIKIPEDAFVNRLTDGLPTSVTMVTVKEVTLPVVIGESASEMFLFTGKVTSTIRNKDGRSGNRCIKAKSWKQFFKARMGMPADHQCPFIFAGIGCESGTVAAGGPNPLGAPASRTVASIEGIKVTLALGLAPVRPNLYHKGYVSFDGINIDIREFDGSVDDTVLYLTRQPPTYWIGQSIVIHQGCDKTIENCRDWNNEGNFGGVGFGIPAYNPNFEDSP